MLPKVGSILLIAVVGLVAFEAWRLSTPEVVRLRQTWQFDTPYGSQTVSDVVEIQQSAAIPYLPGGASGRSLVLGRLPVSVALAGTRYYFYSNPIEILGRAVSSGFANPPISMSDLPNAHTTGFIQRLSRANARIAIPVADLTTQDRGLFSVGTVADAAGNVQGSVVRLADFEATHPRFHLRSISYVVTTDPITSGADEHP